MKNKLFLAGVFVAVWFGWSQFAEQPSTGSNQPDVARPQSVGYDKSATRNAPSSTWQSGQQVRGTGRVIRILSDDNDGSRHQRFIIEIGTGRTLLVAHNIDLAPRVASLKQGDTVEFNGEYEWNDRGGVIHWTHLDPRGSHEAGWLRHNGRLYQ